MVPKLELSHVGVVNRWLIAGPKPCILVDLVVEAVVEAQGHPIPVTFSVVPVGHNGYVDVTAQLFVKNELLLLLAQLGFLAWLGFSATADEGAAQTICANDSVEALWHSLLGRFLSGRLSLL